jgi:hypothetical protein
MRRGVRSFRFLLLQLAEAVVGLLKAELDALSHDFRNEARRLLRIAAIFSLTAGVVFWGFGLLLFSAVELLGLWLPRWGAALSLAGALGLLAFGLAVRARHEVERLRSPKQIVTARLKETAAFLARGRASRSPIEPSGTGAGEP